MYRLNYPLMVFDTVLLFLNKHKKQSITVTFTPLLHHAYETVSQWIVLNILILLLGIRKKLYVCLQRKSVLFRTKTGKH